MNDTSFLFNLSNRSQLEQQADDHYINGKYDVAASLYEQAIAINPSNKTNYWYLGLSQLLQDQENDAQMTWFLALDDAEPEEVEQFSEELYQVLEIEANRHATLSHEQAAITIRYSLREVNPYSLSNLVSIVLLSIKLKIFTSEILIDLGLIELIESGDFLAIDSHLLQETLVRIFTVKTTEPIIFQFAELLCLSHLQYRQGIVEQLLRISGNWTHDSEFAIRILEMGLRIAPQNTELFLYLIDFNYQTDNEKCIEIAKEFYAISIQQDRAINKVLASQWLIKALVYNCDYWNEAAKVHQECNKYFWDLVKGDPNDLSAKEASYYLQVTGYYAPYFSDNPQEAHAIRQAVRQFAYQKIYNLEKEHIENYKKRSAIRKRINNLNRPLKIGYLSNFLRRHSVGFLARWLIQYHNRDRFELYGYLGSYQENDPLQVWFANQFHRVYKDKSYNPLDLANQIHQDRIDILIDLDSLTNAFNPGVLALKPAPIQATWLGWDAIGQPNIDYFIADPYVLPESAQEYYTEKIWRLPSTYLAVDGFETIAPTIRRDLLNIPNDAIVYLSSQAAMKRHPDTIRLQMRIIKLVPNSYLLLKGFGNQTSLQEFFYQLADLEGISTDRLVFLPYANGEAEHRANLTIADVVLDTYPYNGATHTMETLWMGVPMVTRVGEQFVARNSYGMMINAGITEGIAWTDEEYVEWGVRLGTDADLRQQVVWKLRQGRQTAPLWDSRKFTQEMENAYEQMWAKYLESEEQEIDLDPERDRSLFMAEAELQNTQGIQFAQQNQLDSAIVSFQNAIALQSNYADAYYNLGIALSEQEDFAQALVNFQKTVSLNPNHANALYNLGLICSKQDHLDAAIAYYSQALVINPDDIDTHLALGNALFEQGQWDSAIKAYQSALAIDPNSASAHCSIGAALSEQGHLEQSIDSLQIAIRLDPNDAQAYCNLGHVLSKSNQMTEAIDSYSKALQLKPDLGNAYWNFNNDILASSDYPLKYNYALRRQIAQQFVDNCGDTDKVRSLINFISNYTHSGLSNTVLTALAELEKYIFTNRERLNNIEIEVLYNNFLFIVYSLRDELSVNTHLSRFIGNLYAERVIKAKIKGENTKAQFPATKSSKSSRKTDQLRIGFISPHFARHPVSWCSFDVIQELSKITPHIYLYATGKIKRDDRTQMFEQVAEKYYWYVQDDPSKGVTFSERLTKVTDDISQDGLDVLIDLDSLTIPLNIHVLYRRLAPVCISWLGLDAPFISSENYCLCDWHTHPSTSNQHYLEKLVRLPDAHMAIAGFECLPIDRQQQRNLLGITDEQVVYLFAAPGRKFNRENAQACIQILHHVPNSVLLHKGTGDIEIIKSIYQRECDVFGLDYNRVKFLPSYKTEEEHRAAYLLADIFLDSYPYNGGSHNLEALWFNLPIVTRVGQQSFARMGYSFLQSIGLTEEGIANNLEEYVQWGINLGIDAELRNSIKKRLRQSKEPDTLSPLWNPNKLAKDMYSLLENLLE
ncbi:tetratricopeptide repeat protein [Pseudanabaena sp. ABRG5-3]|uniref:O-linked N-acetylglucosamine transferase, SPINDLY family protein n=1 Tax=Pseudanabaena sp. ABRG5-3 TaxID=685565 RepID=UPI000DC71692|nr:tetratricopeptide repeat protein [Pseudanabaena sp. ABRG5-3]BBC22541.1 tetratricopeptide TPR_2 repeat protein [Pseudanabaena sp. ABRG5-3]